MIPFSIRFVMFSSFFNLGLLGCDHIALCDDSQSDTLVAKTATEAMKKATGFMTSQVAVHGGYVYDVTVDLKKRRGEGVASQTEIWVQPPGTPSVGLAFVRAFDATGEQVFLDAANQCAQALMHGQLESGCWTDRVDFDPKGKNAARYRHGKGNAQGRNYSSLDDDKSQSALRFLIELDRAHGFQEAAIHEAVQYGLEALLKAQFTNGGFPQAWEKPVEPQPAWAQQYNHQLQPIWARKFEPPAVAGRESEDVIETLFFLAEITRERRFLKPIPDAIAWLKRSRLPDGQIARFYELETNRPLYFTKDDYLLTYDDSNLPTHYGFKSNSNVQKLEVRYQILIQGDRPKVNKSNLKSLRKDADRILGELDSEARWVTDKNGSPAIHSNRPDLSVLFLESNVFSKNLSRLAEFVTAAKNVGKNVNKVP